MRSGLLLLSMTIVAAPALAVYKCETRDGTLYTDAPCAGKRVELPAPPNASDPASARHLAEKERKQLATIEKQEEHAMNERRRREAGREKTMAAIRKRCTQLGLERKWERRRRRGLQPTGFRAIRCTATAGSPKSRALRCRMPGQVNRILAPAGSYSMPSLERPICAQSIK